MHINTHSKNQPDAADVDLAALHKLNSESRAFIEDNDPAAAVLMKADLERFQTVLDNIAQGVCFFNPNQQLIYGNRRYAEIYRLRPQDIPPGTTLREIVERRIVAGTGPTASVEEYLSEAKIVMQRSEPTTRVAKLVDGREILIWNQRMRDGGWLSTHDDITENKYTSTSLQTLIDWVPDQLFVKDTDSTFLVVNDATVADKSFITTGEPATRASLVGKTDFDLFPRDVAQQFRNTEVQVMKSGVPLRDVEELNIDQSGRAKWVSMTKIPLRRDDGEVFGLIGVARDITERKKDENLREGQALVLEMIATNSPIKEILDELVYLVESQLTDITCSILLLDSDGRHLRHGSAPNLPEAYCKAIDGVAIGPDAGACGAAAYRQKSVIVSDVMSDPPWAAYRDLATQHNLRSCWSTPIISNESEVLGTFAMYSSTVREPTVAETGLIDITTRMAGIAMERKLADDRIKFMATHDALTGLPNRTLLNDRLMQAISHAERYGHCVSVVFIDLDKFKEINDSLGHNAGDELLKTVAKRMVSCVRSIDTVVRLGGDEFVILLPDQPKNIDVTVEILHRLRTSIAEPMRLAGHELQVTCSIGLANYPDDGKDADSLLANADAAMYRAKESGRDNFQFYTPELNVSVDSKFVMQEDLRQALARKEIFLDYQPQVDLRTGKIFSVEALLRWKHPAMGMITPNKFIPMVK